MESAHVELQDDEHFVMVYIYTTTPSLSHGDSVSNELYIKRVNDAEHPTDITMSRAHVASDTCAIYFSYIKVNLLLYTCSLDPFEDGILLDTPLVCMHRYCRSFTDGEEECKRQGSPTPSAREAWKRRRKKTELLILQRPDIRAKGRTSGASATAGHPALLPEIRTLLSREHQGRAPSARTSGRDPGHPARPEAPDIRPSARTSGLACVHVSGPMPMYPFRPSLTPS